MSRTQLGRWLLASLPLLLAYAVYGYAVTLPFFLDDGPHFQILAQTNGLAHWGDFAPFPFYRPFTFTVWKFFAPFGYSAAVLHLLNVACFGLAGVLVGQIVRRLLPHDLRQVAALVAGNGFVLFPPVYQAVAMVAALFHLTLALGTVLSVWSALLWLDGRGGRGLLGLCWVSAFVAVFSHESGVLVLPLLIGVVALRGYLRSRRVIGRLLVPVMLICAVYVGLWLAFSPREDTGLTQDLPAALAVLMQGWVFPVVALLRPFVVGDAVPLVVIALAGAAVLVTLAITSTHGHRALYTAGYGVVWYVLAILPAALFLPAGYVLGQPRLALLASAGGALVWGVLIAVIAGGASYKRLRQIVALVLVGVSVYVSLEFLGMRRADFLHLRDWNRAAIAILDESRTGSVVVNAPGFVIPAEDDRRFLIGTEGVLWVDPSLDYNQQFWMNATGNWAVEVVAVPSIQRNVNFRYQAHPPTVEGAGLHQVVADARRVVVTQFDGRTFMPVLVSGEALDVPPSVDAIIGDGYRLIGADVRYEAGQVIVTAGWTVTDAVGMKMFVHVYCEDDFIAQSDGYPWGDTYPFAAWEANSTHIDRRVIPVTVSPACLQVYTGLYRESDGERLPAVAADTGVRYPNDQVPLLESTD